MCRSPPTDPPDQRRLEIPITERTYIVEGMTCAHCRASVIEEVQEIRGVHGVEVDLPTRRLMIRGEEVEDSAVQAAVEEAGYRVAA